MSGLDDAWKRPLKKRKPGETSARLDPEEAAYRATLRVRNIRIAKAAGGAAALAVLVFAILWFKAGAGAFYIRDARTGVSVSDWLLAVVIDARRKPSEPFATRAALLPPDLFGRYEPAPLGGDEVSEIYVFHIAYKPVVRGFPREGAITVESHGGTSFPEHEAELRALGDLSPPVAAALKAGFLRPGPSARGDARARHPTGPSATRVAPRTGEKTGASGAAGTAASSEATAGPFTETSTASVAPATTSGEQQRLEADALARAIDKFLRADASDRADLKRLKAALVEALDLYIAEAPQGERLKGSAFLARMVARALEDRSASYDLSRRLVVLAGAIHHGTGSAPPPFVGFGDIAADWPDAARWDFAVAAARIGGRIASKELAQLLRLGRTPIDAELIAHLTAGGSRGALSVALEEELKSQPPPSVDETARIEAALKAIAPQGSSAGTGEPQR